MVQEAAVSGRDINKIIPLVEEEENEMSGIKKKGIILLIKRSVCKVRTQDPENFDEEVKSLLTAWRIKGQGMFYLSSVIKESLVPKARVSRGGKGEG